VSFLAQRRGALVALVVGVTILVLYVVLQPGDRPEQVAAVTTTSTPEVTTTTLPPLEELCGLAIEFEEAARGQDAVVTARLAESFYDRAKSLAPTDAQPEYAAAANYYTEFNNIGEPYEYDLFAILGSPDGERWTRLVFGEPLGVATARANVSFLCKIDVPPPPTITTTTTRPRSTTTGVVDGASTVPGDTTPGATSAPGTSAPLTPPPTAAPG
jgi:hypothetical protein